MPTISVSLDTQDRSQALSWLIGIVTLVAMLLTMAGWLLEEPRLLVSLNGRILFNGALCLALAALALLASPKRPLLRDRTRIACGAAISVLSLATLFQYVSGIELGIDWPALHQSVVRTSLYPGRMSLATCIAFLLYGIACTGTVWARSRKALYAVRGLLALVVTACLLTLAGHALGLNAMFDTYEFRLMAAPTAMSLFLVATGLWLSWNPQPAIAIPEDDRIVLTGAVVVTVLGIVIGLAGLIALKNNAAQSLGDGLLLTVQGRANLLTTVLDDNLSDAESLATRPDLLRLQRDALAQPGNRARIEALAKAARDELAKGYSAIEFQDAHGTVIAGVGSLLPDSSMLFALKRQLEARIYWNSGFVLRTKVPVLDGTAIAGFVVLQQPMPVVTSQIFDVRSLGKTGELSVCGADERLLFCSPQRLRRGAFEVSRRQSGSASPMDLAIEGNSGAMETVDYRGQRVLSAHAPAGDFGIGIALKIDTAEIFEPLRTRLAFLAPLILFVLGLGVLVLRLAVKPLASRLHASEQQLSLALQASRLALWDWDARSDRVYLSDQWQAMLGGKPQPTVTTLAELRGLIHAEDGPKVDEGFRDAIKGAAPGYDVEHRVRTGDGWLWIRSRGEVVERSRSGRALRMTGTNSDISARKEMQVRLLHQATHDTLTGLPNRSLFYDRLSQAIARSRRSGALMAVMYLDIDKFKNINDTLGHDAGDDLLKAFSQRLAACVRATDTVARLGGDEYAVVLESLGSREDGHRLAEKIVAAMRPPFPLQNRELTITNSLGVAFYKGESELGPDGLVKMADEALYRAKHAGRNNYQVYDEKPEGKNA